MPDQHGVPQSDGRRRTLDARVSPSAGDRGGIPRFVPGSRVSARIVSDLGEGRYTAEIRVVEGEGGVREVAPQGREAGDTVRLVIESGVRLPPGGEAVFAVGGSAEEPVLDVLQVRGPGGARPAAHEGHSAFRQSVIEAVIPLPADAGAAAVRPIRPGMTFYLTVNESGQVMLEPTGAASTQIPRDQPLVLSEATQQVPASAVDALSELPRAPGGGNEVDVLGGLVRLVRTAPAGAQTTFTVAASEVRQPVSVEFAPTSGQGAARRVLRGVLRVFPGVGEAAAPTAAAAAEGSGGAGQEATSLETGLPAQEPVSARVTASTRGQLQISLGGREVTVQVPGGVELPDGTGLRLLPEPPRLVVQGRVEAHLPRPLPAAESSAAYSSLEQMVRDAGYLPQGQARAAGAALLAEGLSVTKSNLQAVLAAVASSVPSSEADGGDPAALPPNQQMLRAAAHILQQGSPLTPPLVRGVAQMLAPRSSPAVVLESLLAAVDGVEVAARRPGGSGASLPTSSRERIEGLAEGVRSALQRMEVEIGSARNVAESLQAFVRTFRGPELQSALNHVTEAMQAALAGRSDLQAVDALLTALSSTGPLGDAAAEGIAAETTQAQAGMASAPSTAGGRAGGISDRVGVEGAPAGEEAAPRAAAWGAGVEGPDAATPAAEGAGAGAGTRGAAPRPDSVGVLISRLLGMENPPEGSRPELLPRLVQTIFGSEGEVTAEERAALERLFSSRSGELRAGEARQAAQTLRPETATRLATVLADREQAAMQQDPLIRQLGDLHEGLRNLAERASAFKAETIAGMRQEPGIFVAEVPFREGGEGSDGRLQVWYRRRKRGNTEAHSHRVLLDLNTTRLGAVVGDLRFQPSQLDLAVRVEDEDARAHLHSGVGELEDGLKDQELKLEVRIEVDEITGPAVPAGEEEQAEDGARPRQVRNGDDRDEGTGPPHLDVRA
jgi:hypothetical protein